MLGKHLVPLTLLVSLQAFAGSEELFQTPMSILSDQMKATLLDVKEKSLVLYTFERKAEQKENSLIHIHSTYYDPKGEKGAEERILYENGTPVSIEQERFGQETLCRANFRKDGTIEYTRFEHGKVVKTDKEKVDDLTVITDQIFPVLFQNWEMLKKGDTFKFRLVLPCRLETFGFKIFKDEDVTYQGIPAIRFKMKPKSFVLAAVVPALYFIVESAQPHRMLEYQGHVLPLKKV